LIVRYNSISYRIPAYFGVMNYAWDYCSVIYTRCQIVSSFVCSFSGISHPISNCTAHGALTWSRPDLCMGYTAYMGRVARYPSGIACWTQTQKDPDPNRSLRQTVHTHCASVHQAAKLAAAFLRVAGVTAGLAKSNGNLPPGFMTHVTCRLTAKNRDQLRNLTLDKS